MFLIPEFPRWDLVWIVQTFEKKTKHNNSNIFIYSRIKFFTNLLFINLQKTKMQIKKAI